MEYAPTAHNRSVYASPPSAARATKKRSRGIAPLCVFSPPHFFAPVKMLRIFLYRAQKNVIYRRNVIRNTKVIKYFENIFGVNIDNILEIIVYNK